MATAPRTDVPNLVALAAGAENFDTVMVDGRIRTRHGNSSTSTRRGWSGRPRRRSRRCSPAESVVEEVAQLPSRNHPSIIERCVRFVAVAAEGAGYRERWAVACAPLPATGGRACRDPHRGQGGDRACGLHRTVPVCGNATAVIEVVTQSGPSAGSRLHDRWNQRRRSTGDLPVSATVTKRGPQGWARYAGSGSTMRRTSHFPSTSDSAEDLFHSQLRPVRDCRCSMLE